MKGNYINLNYFKNFTHQKTTVFRYILYKWVFDTRLRLLYHFYHTGEFIQHLP